MWLEAQDGNNMVEVSNIYIKEVKVGYEKYFSIFNSHIELGKYPTKERAEQVLTQIKLATVRYEVAKAKKDNINIEKLVVCKLPPYEEEKEEPEKEGSSLDFLKSTINDIREQVNFFYDEKQITDWAYDTLISQVDKLRDIHYKLDNEARKENN